MLRKLFIVISLFPAIIPASEATDDGGVRVANQTWQVEAGADGAAGTSGGGFHKKLGTLGVVDLVVKHIAASGLGGGTTSRSVGSSGFLRKFCHSSTRQSGSRKLGSGPA